MVSLGIKSPVLALFCKYILITKIYYHNHNIKFAAAHPGDDPDGCPDLGVPGKVVLVLLPLLHLGLLQPGLPLPGQAHPLDAQYVIR